MNTIEHVVRSAYAAELGGLKHYSSISNKSDLYALILSVREQGVTILLDCAKFNSISLDDVNAMSVNMCVKEDDILISSIAFENNICFIYEQLCNSIEDEVVKDLFFRLWATSNNEFIPALKQALKDLYASKDNMSLKNISDSMDFDTNNPLQFIDKYQSEFNKINQDLNNIVSKRIDQEEIKQLLKNPHFSFYSGMSLGALAAAAISKSMEKKNETNQ